MRSFIVASFGGGLKILIRLGIGGAVEVYRLHDEWEADGPRLDRQTQMSFDAETNEVALTRPWGVERGVKLDLGGVKRLLKSHPPPWAESM